ncbi:nuclear transport factor 2 family protein [Pedobacter rhodius]|uniref:Nuclear transport factor 2 family protein n=1 Tax=Pedobacter rhodius TaxID=3004098 RepID=A0ABT4L338_9SPHI|nr:nuclear transport factor 2 family protein [Pedobacter sp. SJ11]MCZ4225490.1 nuclear transport factor 2 family protein [Pedobacter sp. SJ11]
MMSAKEILKLWVEAFNRADIEVLINLYAENAINHQVANAPVEGRNVIKKMFEAEFANAEMVCKPINIFEDGDWAIMEWQDPKGFSGCGFFQVKEGKIILQRGYWDKLSFHKLYEIPL